MVMVEYFADASACAFGDFACALGGAHADVLASDGSAFAHIAGGLDRVKCDKIARAFPNTLGRRSSALGGSFADVPSASADVATRATLVRLLPGGRLHRAGRLRRGLGLAALGAGVLAAQDKADGECECEECNGRFWRCVSHGLDLRAFRFEASVEDSRSKTEKLGAEWRSGYAW
jgi:hypothetical protein